MFCCILIGAFYWIKYRIYPTHSECRNCPRWP